MELEVIRKVDAHQLDHLKVLFDDVHAHDHHDALGEHKWLDLIHGGRPGFAGVIAKETGHDHPVGYAHLSRHERKGGAEWGLEMVVHPEHRGVGVEVAVAERALELVREAGGGHLHMWVFQPTEIHDGIAHRLGFTRGRDLIHMSVPLPPRAEADLPAGVTIRPFEIDRDERAWLDLNNRAFEHHPEQGAWDAETLRRRMTFEWFDAGDLLLAVDPDGEIVGSNWTKLDHDRGIGEIYVLAVDPERHGGGLGRALSLAGLEHMADRGMTEGHLYVDSANDAALKMYSSIGFSSDHRDRAYVIDIPGGPGPELNPR
ncbi:MAG: mycothiol synthase [Actinomycetota bacterium]